VAVHLAQEGMTREAGQVVRDIRARYDGEKRNPFDEAECGHHYARAMASWGLVPAWSGFFYSAVTNEMSFAAPKGRARWPWAAGSVWGTAELERRRRGVRLTLRVAGGRLRLRKLAVGGGEVIFSRTKTLAPGGALSVEIPFAA
jgi:hypothetical protein